MESIYITTPIYYVNDRPHMGHAYASIHADVLARYSRLAGRNTFFLTGADEHGEKIAKAATENGELTQAFVNRNAQLFIKAWKELGVEPDDFVRTTLPAHKAYVSQALQRLYNQGDIYQAEYEGLYSIGQERFVTEKELIDGKLPEDKEPPQLRRETNYFFRMEKYRIWVKEFIESNPQLIQPENYAREMLALLEEPIGDLSISRPSSRLSWGIPLPWDADHVTYVWFDALLSYVSPLATNEAGFARYWPNVRHIIGKDILRPHTLFWLAMCKALELDPYKKLFVSGHLLGSDGRKMSKSLNNGVDPLAAAEKYTSDVLRFVLVREIPFGVDGVISEKVIENRLDKDLANDLGNLVSRTLTMIGLYCDFRVPVSSAYADEEAALQEQARHLQEGIMEWVDDMKIRLAMENVMAFVREMNRYVSACAPWKLAKDPSQRERLQAVLQTLHEGLVVVSTLLSPVLPEKMKALRVALGVEEQPQSLHQPWQFDRGVEVTNAPFILFAKVNTES
ncbi:methionine--tRNA ligase [Pseudomonas fluorescens]|uniref:Methionine--tRNA ligase n=1 Tax=Pseudomonas fluorescens TaxID=294 RepID=A0A423LWJ5_PSEFL|nr:methionine--tRNA ligase [Pseudomonas fluorescens]RON72686.1 methionine--tRNA ligase [Pseudomonas fluorescens]